MSRRTLVDEVLADMASLAASRQRDPSKHWVCGACGRGHADGVRVFYTKKVLEVRRGKEIVDFASTLFCPACSLPWSRTSKPARQAMPEFAY